MRFTICPCSQPDDSGWLALRRALFPQRDEPALRAEMARLAARPEHHAQFLVIDEEGEPVGLAEVSLRTDYVHGAHGSPVAFLEAVYVAPHARRHGLARALVTHAREWGRAHGCTEFASDALLDNADSLALHRALGFEETTRIVCFRQRTVG
jgi:aminoglycoside 6'-N-acetyltransferase I